HDTRSIGKQFKD
ncbi:unnamed protein product, partial [Allacma fusca]